MAEHNEIHLLTGDLGYGLWDRIKIDFPNRFHNFGSSEQLMGGAACGMATSGIIPVVYSITPFVLYRPYEFIRNYIDHEKIPVKLLGGGREKDYGYLGFSHWAEDDSKVMSNFSNIKSIWPSDEESLEQNIDDYLFDGRPNYMNLSR